MDVTYENLIIEKEGHTALLTINRPKAMNALNSWTLKELQRAFEELALDDDVWVIIVTGAGRAFVAGADISEMRDMDDITGREYGELGQQVFTQIERTDKPVIAAINGFALGGGCELAMACDIRLASMSAKFGQPEVGLGVTPGFGGTQRLPRLVGRGKAKELIFTGDMLSAEEGERLGLVNRVIDDWKRDDAGEIVKNEKGKPVRDETKLIGEAKALASKICEKGQLSVRYAKAAINVGIEAPLDGGLKVEAEVFGKCFATKDQKEGMTAFLDKRKPGFKLE